MKALELKRNKQNSLHFYNVSFTFLFVNKKHKTAIALTLVLIIDAVSGYF